MSPASIAMLSVSMSADAFTASLAQGASLERPRLREALRTGLVFGIVEAITPVIGWAAGLAASGYIAAIDHWIAFLLLTVIGCRMLMSAAAPSEVEEKPRRQSLAVLVGTAFGTSIDAMAVGVSLAFLDVHIAVVAVAIGVTTFVFATAGILLARHLGARFGRWAEGLGGLFLIGIGFTILIEHLFLAS